MTGFDDLFKPFDDILEDDKPLSEPDVEEIWDESDSWNSGKQQDIWSNDEGWNSDDENSIGAVPDDCDNNPEKPDLPDGWGDDDEDEFYTDNESFEFDDMGL